MRVVSLLPSATESLAAIGAQDLLVGRSHECDHPPSITDRPVLTSPRTDPETSPSEIDSAVRDAASDAQSLYHLDEHRLQELRPDLIITQDLCPVCSIDLDTVRRVAQRLDPQPEILSLNPRSFEDVMDDLLRIGRAVHREDAASDALVRLRERFYDAANHVNPYAAHPTAVLLEWADPLFVGGHWTPQLIERAGALHPLNPTEPLPGAGAGAGAQAAHRVAGPSIRVPPDVLAALRPDILILAPCGRTLEQTRKDCAILRAHDWFNHLPAVHNGRVALVDGNQMFNRPGPRLVDAYRFLVGWINQRPELIPQDFPWEPLAP